MLLFGVVYNMKLKCGMSNTKWVLIDTNKTQWLQSAEPIRLPGNHDASWVLASMCSVLNFPGPQRELVLVVPSPFQPLCLFVLWWSASQPISKPFSRSIRIQTHCHCWPPFCFLPFQFLILTSISPHPWWIFPSAYSVFKPHHSLYYILYSGPNTFPFLPKIGILPLLQPKKNSGIFRVWYSILKHHRHLHINN